MSSSLGYVPNALHIQKKIVRVADVSQTVSVTSNTNRILMATTVLFALSTAALAIALPLEILKNNNTADKDTEVASDTEECNASSVDLSSYPQWQHEEGYWVGEYSFYGSDGDPNESPSWNYRYDHYKGFITGNVQSNKYRQRNVFMYPAQVISTCAGNNATQGNGTCGINGNMKLYAADQSKTTCNDNPSTGGDIEGPYGSLSYTTTELIGRNNSLLYQVWLTKEALALYEGSVLENPYGRCEETAPYTWYCGVTGPNDTNNAYPEDRLMQSQLTTLTQLPTGQWLRTRTAQGFEAFNPSTLSKSTYASYYRETQVSETEFWTEFNATQTSYTVMESDTCMWKSKETGGVSANSNGYGFASCRSHLEESFEL
jgi:hypothetical protein